MGQDDPRPVIGPDYIGIDRRHDPDPTPPGRERRRSQADAEQRAFSRAVEAATLAATREVTKTYLRRQMLLLLAVVVTLSAAVAIPVALNADAANRATTSNALKEDCNLVVMGATIFDDYIAHENVLRQHRSRNPHAVPQVRAFDRAIVHYWRMVTLPALDRFLGAQCTGGGPVMPGR